MIIFSLTDLVKSFLRKMGEDFAQIKNRSVKNPINLSSSKSPVILQRQKSTKKIHQMSHYTNKSQATVHDKNGLPVYGLDKELVSFFLFPT